jgi:hypothetical protein
MLVKEGYGVLLCTYKVLLASASGHAGAGNSIDAFTKVVVIGNLADVSLPEGCSQSQSAPLVLQRQDRGNAQRTCNELA